MKTFTQICLRGGREVLATFISLAMVLLLVPGLQSLAHAESTDTIVSIGSGTSTATNISNKIPIHAFDKNGLTEMLYKASDIGTAGVIKSLTFTVGTAKETPSTSFKIYLATTSSEELSGFELDNLTEVYAKTDTTTGAVKGDETFTLDTPFNYNGKDNLLIVTQRYATSYASVAYVGAYVDYTCSITRGSDTITTTADIPGSGTATKQKWQPNLKLAMEVCPHTNKKLQSHKDATCTEAGYDEYYCSDCEKTWQDAIAALRHDWVKKNEVKPTCTEAGSIGYACSRCSEAKSDTVAALGHDIAGQPVSIGADGTKTTVCKRCKQVVPAVSTWNGSEDVAESFSAGTGTQEDPYFINSAAELALMAQKVNSGDTLRGDYFKLNIDIDLNGKEWTPIGRQTYTYSWTTAQTFAGVFDGGNHVISGLYINDTKGHIGLFGAVGGERYIRAGIKNLTVQGSVKLSGTVGTAYEGVGGIVGYAQSFIDFENLTNKVTVTSGGGYVAGVVGKMDNRSDATTTMTKCVNEADICGYGYVAGITGDSHNNTTISLCKNTGSISATNASGYGYAAGIVGRLYQGSSVTSCYNTGTITSAGYGASGIAAYMSGSVYSSTNGSVEVKNCYNTADAITVTSTSNPNTYAGIAAFGYATGTGIETKQIVSDSYSSTKKSADFIPIIGVDSESKITATNCATMELSAMQNPSFVATLNAGDYANTWKAGAAGSTPLLSWEPDPIPEYAASIGDVTYDTIDEALTAAKSGDTIKLFKDVEKDAYTSIDIDLTIDFNGHTWTSSKGGFDLACNKAGSSLTLKNGTLKAERTAVWNQNAGKLVVESDMTIIGDSANANSDSYGVVVEDKDTQADIYGKVSSISGIGNASDADYVINVFDGAYIGSDENKTVEIAIYNPNGNLNISGGTITGNTAVYVKSGKTKVTGGIIAGAGAKADYTYKPNGCIATGDGFVIDSCGYPGGAPQVSITGGTFSSAHAKAIASYVYGDNTRVDQVVSGGSFNTDPSDLLEEGAVIKAVSAEDGSVTYDALSADDWALAKSAAKDALDEAGANGIDSIKDSCKDLSYAEGSQYVSQIEDAVQKAGDAIDVLTDPAQLDTITSKCTNKIQNIVQEAQAKSAANALAKAKDAGIKNIASKVTKLSGKISALENLTQDEKDAFTTQLTTLQTNALTELDTASDADAANAIIESVLDALGDVWADASKKDGVNKVSAELNTQINNLKDQVQGLTSDKDKLNADLTKLQNDYDALKAQKEQTEKENAEAITSLNKRIESLDAQVKDLQSQVKGLQDKDTENQAKIAELEAQISNLQAEKTSLTAQVESLTERNEELNSSLEDLKAEIEGLKADKRALEEANAGLNDDKSALQQKFDEMKAAYDLLGNPASMRVQSTTYNSIKLAWNKGNAAQGFDLYMNGKLVTTTSETGQTFAALLTGTNYKFDLVPYINVGDVKVVGKTVTVTAKPSLAKGKVKSVKAGKKKVTVKWSKVAGANGYQIKYVQSGKTKYKLVKSAKTVKKVVTKLKTGKKVKVKVRAYRSVNGKAVYGAWSSAKSKKVK